MVTLGATEITFFMVGGGSLLRSSQDPMRVLHLCSTLSPGLCLDSYVLSSDIFEGFFDVVVLAIHLLSSYLVITFHFEIKGATTTSNFKIG